jgi:hypothetical protein
MKPINRKKSTKSFAAVAGGALRRAAKVVGKSARAMVQPCMSGSIAAYGVGARIS